MKKMILSIVLAMLTLTTYAQFKDGYYGEVEKTIECQKDKDQLWSNAKRWIATTFNSYKYTVDMEDKSSGTIILKFNKNVNYFSVYTNLNLSASLQIDIKDNKFRYRIFDASFSIKPGTQLQGDISWMPTDLLKMAKEELKAVERLVRDDVSIPKGLDMSISVYSSMLESTPKYSKPKDEKKGKVNTYWSELDKTVNMAKRIQTNFCLLTNEIKTSLTKGMNYSDDF